MPSEADLYHAVVEWGRRQHEKLSAEAAAADEERAVPALKALLAAPLRHIRLGGLGRLSLALPGCVESAAEPLVLVPTPLDGARLAPRFEQGLCSCSCQGCCRCGSSTAACDRMASRTPRS
eukprot:SAG11_NODE_2460_length_3337_cov_3.537544_3_plen_121_part_00